MNGSTARSEGRRHSIVRLFGLNFASEVGGQAIAFLIGAYLARVLSPDAFGAWVFATAVLAFLVVLVDGGTETWGLREVSASPASLRSSVLRIIRLRLLFALLAIGILLSIALTRSDLQRWVFLFGAGSILAAVIQTSWAHRALHSAAPAAIIFLQRLTLLALVLILVQRPEQASDVTFWQGTTELIASVLLVLLLLARMQRQAERTSSDVSLTSAFLESAPLGASRLLRNLPPAFAPALLGFFSSSIELGGFGAAAKLAIVFPILSNVFSVVSFPIIARACSQGGALEERAITASLRLLAFLIAPVCVGGVLLAQPLLELAFTKTYAGASLPLQLLFLAYTAMSFSDHLRRILHARRQARSDLQRVGLATLATLGFLAFAVATASATGAAATGAAAAVLVGELLLLALSWHALGPAPRPRKVLQSLAEPFLAAAIMGLPVLLLRSEPVHIPILVGAAVYCAFAWFRRSELIAELRAMDVHLSHTGERAETIGDRQLPL